MIKFLKRSLVKNSAERWDHKYAKGDWKWLRNIHELGHYSILAGYFQYLKPGGSILDVGCGEGLLQERISSAMYSNYTGIDISAEAIKQAKHKEDDKTFFEAADMQTYVPKQKFDAIVFNESLYYVRDQATVVNRYAQFLNDKGIFIFSNFENQENKLPWSVIERSFPKFDETKVISSSGSLAVCKVLVKG